MKLSSIFVLFIFSAMVRGWAAYLQPIVLSIGAAFTALNIDVEPLLGSIQPIKLPKWLSKKDKLDEPFEGEEIIPDVEFSREELDRKWKEVEDKFDIDHANWKRRWDKAMEPRYKKV